MSGGFGFPSSFGMSPCAIRQHSATVDELISSQAKALHCNRISCATSTSQYLYARVSTLLHAKPLDQRGLVQVPARLVQRTDLTLLTAHVSCRHSHHCDHHHRSLTFLGCLLLAAPSHVPGTLCRTQKSQARGTAVAKQRDCLNSSVHCTPC